MHAVKEYFVVQRHIGELKLYKSFSLNFAMRIIVFFSRKNFKRKNNNNNNIESSDDSIKQRYDF